MKKKYLLVGFFLFAIQYLFAQAYNETIYVCDSALNLNTDLESDGSIAFRAIRFKVNNKKDTVFTQYVFSNNIEVFSSIIAKGIKAGTSNNCNDSANFAKYARQYYLNMYAKIYPEEDAPIAGILKIKNEIPVILEYRYLDKKNNNKKYFIKLRTDDTSFVGKPYIVKKTEYEIVDGFIQNMKVIVSGGLDTSEKTFVLPYPVGINSVQNFKKYFNTKLFWLNENCSRVIKKYDSTVLDTSSINFLIDTNRSLKALDSSFYINLQDIMSYDYAFGVERRDYSPKNQILTVKPGEAITLYKENTQKLLEAKIFTDFIGLNKEKPNGLIQTEIQRRINVNGFQKMVKSNFFYNLYHSYGYFNYISPIVTISKIEGHNRYLTLNDLDSIRRNPNTTDTSLFKKNIHRYTNFLDLLEHQWFTGGFDMNILYLSNHDAKWDFSLNANVRLGLTNVSDSVTNITTAKITTTGVVDNYNVPLLQIGPELKLRFLPEERISFGLTNRFYYLENLSSKLSVVKFDSKDNQKLTPVNKGWMNSSELLVSISTNQQRGNKLFGRLRYNWDIGNRYKNFIQIQVGYSSFILGNNK